MVGASLLLIFLFVIVGGLGLAAIIFWIWMIVDCATNEPAERNDKVVWILIIVLTHLLGAILYFLIRRPQRIKETGK